MSCPACFSGTIDSGTPTGTEITIDGIPAYRAVPKEGTSDRAVVIITDVFGWKLPNVRLVADKTAQQGYQVFVPDFMQNDSVKPDLLDLVIDPAPSFLQRSMQCLRLFGNVPSVIAWMRRHGEKQTVPLVNKVLDALRNPQYGISKIAIQGYCWGGRFAIYAAATDKVDAFVSIHPGSVKVPDDIRKVRHPGIFILAADDMSFNKKAIAGTRKVAEEMSGTIRIAIKEYQGVHHGFAIRGRSSDPKVLEAREDAIKQACDFLDSEFAKTPKVAVVTSNRMG